MFLFQKKTVFEHILHANLLDLYLIWFIRDILHAYWSVSRHPLYFAHEKLMCFKWLIEGVCGYVCRTLYWDPCQVIFLQIWSYSVRWYVIMWILLRYWIHTFFLYLQLENVEEKWVHLCVFHNLYLKLLPFMWCEGLFWWLDLLWWTILILVVVPILPPVFFLH